MVALSSALALDDTDSVSAVGRPKTAAEFSAFTPEMLGLAARAVIRGDAGFAQLADRLRSAMEARPRLYGRRKQVGGVATLAYDRHLSDAVRHLLREAINRNKAVSTAKGLTRKRVASEKHLDALPPETDEWLPVMLIAKRLGLPKQAVGRLAESSELKVIRAGGAMRSPLLMKV